MSSELPSLGNPIQPSSDLPRLGSLTQAARQKQLNTARGILIAIGILTIVGNIIFYFMVESQVNDVIKAEIAQARQPGFVIDESKVNELRQAAVRAEKLIKLGTIVLGAVFVGLGLSVKKYPVPATVTGLVLYIGAAAIFALLNPMNLLSGIIIKIIIVAMMIKSIQAAVAYQREKDAAFAEG
jgi:hypothetical protein